MSAIHIAAWIIPTIGRPEFPDRLLAAFRELAECDFCSAFSWDAQGRPRLLLAAGMHPRIPGFALSASRAYVQTFWRLDLATRHGMTQGSGSPLVRVTADDIGDTDYRRDCYQRAGICERLTLLDTDSPTLSVSGYRTVSRGPITSQIARRMEEAGPALLAALRRHTELIDQTGQVSRASSHSLLLKRVREWGLSAREAEVAAGLASGQRQADIARNAGLTLNSVITYRRRAYQKLRVSDRLQLRAMCERMAAPAES